MQVFVCVRSRVYRSDAPPEERQAYEGVCANIGQHVLNNKKLSCMLSSRTGAALCGGGEGVRAEIHRLPEIDNMQIVFNWQSRLLI